MLACLVLAAALVACSSQQQPAATNSTPVPTAQLQPAVKPVSDVNLDSMPPDKLATYVFENHGCKNCHTLGKGGKLGFTEHGKEVIKNFEGCIRLLTAMDVISQVSEEKRSAQEKEKAARFQEFGCTTCHQIAPGKLGLTPYGAKLASLHMACTDVERILGNKQGE